MTRFTRQCLLMVGSHAVNSPCVHSKKTEDVQSLFCAFSQMHKTNIVCKEAQLMTGQDNQKRSGFFFRGTRFPFADVNSCASKQDITKQKKLHVILSFLPGRLHSPETSSVFNFFSRSATRFPRILQGAHMSRCLLLVLLEMVRSHDRAATCWCASGAG